jgi:hypothetical protein
MQHQVVVRGRELAPFLATHQSSDAKARTSRMSEMDWSAIWLASDLSVCLYAAPCHMLS